jgi:hypothetical protein
MRKCGCINTATRRLSIIRGGSRASGLVICPQSEYSHPMGSIIGNTVIETESFIKQAAALWSSAEPDDLKDYVARNPLAGDEMPGTGGLRKLRWRRAGMGKRGGARDLLRL